MVHSVIRNVAAEYSAFDFFERRLLKQKIEKKKINLFFFEQ